MAGSPMGFSMNDFHLGYRNAPNYQAEEVAFLAVMVYDHICTVWVASLAHV